MNRRSLGAIAGLTGVAVLAAWAVAGPGNELGPRPQEERPALALLSSLPLVFGESFGLEGGGSPALTRLEQRYKVLPVGVADAESLSGQRLLLMAHPRAQPAEALVDLDHWVRRGGNVVLLADPKLDWPSALPFGDRLRPQPAFADTGLLAHWGMKLGSAVDRGWVAAGNGKIDVMASSPGKLTSDRCKLAGDGFVARCKIGRGRVTVIADADFLNVENDAEKKPDVENLELLLDELDRIESR